MTLDLDLSNASEFSVRALRGQRTFDLEQNRLSIEWELMHWDEIINSYKAYVPTERQDEPPLQVREAIEMATILRRVVRNIRKVLKERGVDIDDN